MLKKIKEHISNLSNEPIEMADQEQKDTEIINNACAALLIETALADKVFNEEEMISMKQTFLQKSEDLKQNLTAFDNSKIINLDNDIKKNSDNLEDSKLKITELELSIKNNDEEIPNLIMDLETNLYRATSTKYIINWNEDAV